MGCGRPQEKMADGPSVIHRIPGASLVLAVLLLVPLLAWGQKFSHMDTQKPDETAAESLTGLLRTDADIDKEVDRIMAQVDGLRSESAGVWAEVTAGGAPGMTASTFEGGKLIVDYGNGSVVLQRISSDQASEIT
jgi:hypothetical protein